MKERDRWTEEEKELLRKVYPEGGLKAAMEALCGSRTRAAIENRAYIMGLRKANKISDKYKPKPLAKNEVITRQKFLSEPQRYMRLLRLEAGLTQKRLAEESGVGQATICQLERGISQGNHANTLHRIFEYFNLENERDQEKPPSGNDVQKLTGQVERLADAAEMLTRQFVRVLEGLVKVEHHDQALDNLADQVARLSNGSGRK